MATTAVCRICLAEPEQKHCIALFSTNSHRENWPRRLHELLGVAVSADDELPHHMCRSCRAKIVSLETKLQQLRFLAFQSQRTIAMANQRKRAKETGAATEAISPDTAVARPPAKRQYGARRTLFSDAEPSASTGKPI